MTSPSYRRDPTSNPRETDADLVTVVVPARNEEQYIARCLDSILAQTHSSLEVFVVDGASTDQTAKIAQSYAGRDRRVRLLSNPARIVPTGLNIALREARAKWLVRVDAHATIPQDYVERAMHHLRQGTWGAVGGRKDGVGHTAAGRAIAAAMTSPFGVGGSTYHHGSKLRTVEHVPFGCYPVELLKSLGGWDEKLVVNQDFELDWRVRESGHEILFDPELRIDWICRQSLPSLFRQYYRYGHGKTKVARLHPRSVRPRHLIPPLLVLWLAAMGLAGIRRRRIAAALVAPYAGGLALASLRSGRRLDRAAKARLPLAFAAMHAGWGIGFWSGVGDALKDARERSAAPVRSPI